MSDHFWGCRAEKDEYPHVVDMDKNRKAWRRGERMKEKRIFDWFKLMLAKRRCHLPASLRQILTHADAHTDTDNTSLSKIISSTCPLLKERRNEWRRVSLYYCYHKIIIMTTPNLQQQSITGQYQYGCYLPISNHQFPACINTLILIGSYQCLPLPYQPIPYQLPHLNNVIFSRTGYHPRLQRVP
jgi:hypothetical protein